MADLNEAFVFENIKFDHTLIATFCQQFLAQGSRSKRLTKEMLHVYAKADNTPYNSVAEFLIEGNRLFDVVVYLQLPENERPLLLAKPVGYQAPINTLDTLSKGLFLVYFFLFTQADLPDISDPNDRRPMPQFLTTVLKYTESADWHIRNIASFDLRLMEHDWIKSIDLDGLSAEAKGRFALGVAGYRLFSLFKVLHCKDDVTPEAAKAYGIVKRFLARGVFWEMHPSFRPASVIADMGSINGALSNLLIACFTERQLADAQRCKILFNIPTYNLRFDNYALWDDSTFNFAKTLIFEQKK